MITTDKFLLLHRKKVERNELEHLVQEAKQEGNTNVIYRLSKILRDNPNDTNFEISIKKYDDNSTLAAPRHKANYKEALNKFGVLRKGWKFENGNIVKIPVAKFKKGAIISYKGNKGTITKVIKTPKNSSFFGKESYLYNLTYDNKKKAINIPENKINIYIKSNKKETKKTINVVERKTKNQSLVDTPKVILKYTENKHTKTNEIIHVVSILKRVEKSIYFKLKSDAKKLGGYYSKYNKEGAIAGFIFKEKENAENFINSIDKKSEPIIQKDILKDQKEKTTTLSSPKKEIKSVITKPIDPIVEHIPPSKPILITPIEKKVISMDNESSKNNTTIKTLQNVNKKNNNKVFSSSDISNMNFDTLTFNGEWAELMQEPAKNMKLAIWGKPKNGKTAGATKLANYLTNFGSILYNFADQGINKSTKDLWKLSGLESKNNAFLTATRDLKELDELCASGNYNFVFIDMINTYIHRTGIKYFEFEDRFLKKYPNISFILIFEVTKTGNFKGDQGWTHLPDALITVDSFVMHNQGRYGVGEYVIWAEGLKKINPKKYKEFFNDDINSEEENKQEFIEIVI